MNEMAVAMTFRGSRLLARSVTRTILPDKLEIKDGKVHITRRAWFGLKTDEDEIRLKRIASVRVKRGILTGKIIIETSGGGIPELEFSRIWKWQAKKIAKAIREAL